MGLDPTALVAVDSAPDVYPPLTGTAVRAADVSSGEQALLDRTLHAFNGGPTDFVEDRSILFVWNGVTETALASYWTIGNTGQPVQGGAAAALPLYCHLELPNGGSLTLISILLDPAGGHAGAGAGLTFPTLALWKVNNSTGVRTQIESTATDTWNAGAYETAHPLSIVVSPAETIDRDVYRYVLEFTGEAGVNYVANLSVFDVRVTGNFRRLLSPGS